MVRINIFRVHEFDASNVGLDVTRADHQVLLGESVLLLWAIRVFNHAFLGQTDDSPITVPADVVDNLLRTAEELFACHTNLEVGFCTLLLETTFDEVCLDKP